jgi:3D-(3,5/4)-trihydroxycyclohexane-1,2-dione acylhydrolase (decyclizing)
MGYEIAGGLGAKMAAPDRDVYVMVGDGSYLMLANEIVTSIQEGQKLIIVVLDSQGYNSIGNLSRSLGQKGFATRYAFPKSGVLPDDEAGADVEALPVDLAANARSLGAIVFDCTTYDEFAKALKEAKKTDRTTVVHTHVDRYAGVPGYDSWWDVHVAEVSEMASVREARKGWEVMRAKERYFLKGQG